MRIPSLPLLFLAGAAILGAHPDHTANESFEIPLLPATEATPVANHVSITIEGDKRVITSNGVPDHTTGKFPNADNPNRISAQHYRYTVPLKPVAAARPVMFRGQPFGIAVNGVLFDPGTAEAWHDDMDSGWHYDAKGGGFSLGLDANNAHVQPSGAYHYHGIPTALLKRLSGGKPAMTLLGWAADGFPIYGTWGFKNPTDPTSGALALKSGYQLKKGKRPTAHDQPGGTYDGTFVEDYEYVSGRGDLDECSGRTGVTPEFPNGTFYYVLTEDFPFVPRLFRGVPDKSFERHGGPGGPGGRRGPPPGERPPPGQP